MKIAISRPTTDVMHVRERLLDQGLPSDLALTKKEVLDNYAFRISYSYQWEEGDSFGREPEHNVYFYNRSYTKKRGSEIQSEKPLPRNYF